MKLRLGLLAVALAVPPGAVLAACGPSTDATPATETPKDDAGAPRPDGSSKPDTAPPPASGPGLGPGFATNGPWVSFYGDASEMGDLAKAAARYRIINIDVDPGSGNFTDAQIKTLKAGGQNQVISYLNVGSCEKSRDYWNSAPGFVSCGANQAAQIGPYDGYPDEIWMNPSSVDYQNLIVDYVAARLAKRGVDGFYLDNLELLGHGTKTSDGPCDATCSQGGLDLVKRLRDKFPDLLIVMQNGTSDVTRLGTTGGVAFPRLLDGIAHEEVYAPSFDSTAESELLAWKGMSLLSREGRPFWIAVEDYVGDCNNTTDADDAIAKSLAKGFSPYVSDESGEQRVVCYWSKP